MKTIGLIGGMSWESSLTYYRLINEQVKARLGGLHSARLILYSVDFDDIERLQRSGDWDAARSNARRRRLRPGSRWRQISSPVHQHDAQGVGGH